MNRHPLDPGIGRNYRPDCGPRRDFWTCSDDDNRNHCHCDEHENNEFACEWGKREFIRRLIESYNLYFTPVDTSGRPTTYTCEFCNGSASKDLWGPGRITCPLCKKVARAADGTDRNLPRSQQ